MAEGRTISGSFRSPDSQGAQADSHGRLRSRGMHYRRLMLLGTGGMATVHLALAAGPSGFNRLVVVKAMRDELLDQPDARAMFLEEARLCARLNHPNVVQVSEVVDSPAGVMIVMEYLDGRPLSAMYRAGGAFTLPMRLRLVCEVLAGLHYVHELKDFEGEPLGLVHRDVSPHNVFATYDGRVKLLDFGIAKATFASEHTKTGVIKGKLTYMPAEQLRGQPVDRRSDIYSVGCLLWEAIADGRIWAKRPDKEIMTAVLAGKIPALSSRVEVDPRLERIVNRATALDPADRFASAEEMRLALEALLQTTEPVSPRDIGQFLSTAFADAKKQRHAEVAQYIAALPDGTGPQEDVPTQLQVSVTNSNGSQVAAPPAWRKWAAGAVVVALSGAVALAVPSLWRGWERGAPRAAVSRPAAPEVTLSITVVPKTARVSIDGGPASVGGALSRFAPNSEHVVRVESEGYTPVERHVTVGSDTGMSIELIPLPSVASPSPAPATQTAEASHDPPANAIRSSRVKAYRGTAAVKAASSGGADCSPPYYFVGGIKTFKPECI